MPTLRPDELAARTALYEAGYIYCTACSTEKPITDFHRDRTRWSGRQTKCKKCMGKYKATYTRDAEAINRKSCEKAELRKRDIKQCGTCGHLKNRTSFNLRSDSQDGLHTSCSDCTSRSSRESYRAALDADPFEVRLTSGRARARENGRPYEWFTSTELFDYWESHGIDPWVCVWTGEKLTPETVQWDHLIALSHPDSPGHVLSNLVPASASANSSKNSMYFVDFLADRAEKRPPVVLP